MTLTLILSGGIAYLAGVFWPFLPGRRAMICGQAVAAGGFLVYHYTNGTMTGAGISIIFGVQALLALPLERARWIKIAYALTLPAALGITALTWEGPISLAAASAVFFATLSRWQTDTRVMRGLFVLTVLSWLVYNVSGSAWIAAMADVTCLFALGISLWRERRPRFCIGDGCASKMTRFRNRTLTVEESGRRINVDGLSGWECPSCGEAEFDPQSAKHYANAGDKLISTSSQPA